MVVQKYANAKRRRYNAYRPDGDKQRRGRAHGGGALPRRDAGPRWHRSLHFQPAEDEGLFDRLPSNSIFGMRKLRVSFRADDGRWRLL
jgi:hypothetical protein